MMEGGVLHVLVWCCFLFNVTCKNDKMFFALCCGVALTVALSLWVFNVNGMVLMHCVHAPAQQDAGEITTKQATVFQLSTGEVLSPDFTFYSKSLVAVAGLRSAAIGLRRAVVRSNLIQQNHKCPKELSD